MAGGCARAARSAAAVAGVLPLLVMSGCGTDGQPGRAGARQPAAAVTSAPPAAKRTDLTVEVNGDLLIHSPVWTRALANGHGHYDFDPMLQRIAPYLRRADLAWN